MVYVQTKNTNLGFYWSTSEWKMLVYLWPFGIFDSHLVYLMAIWYILWSFGIHIFARFGTLCQEKSGNPDCSVENFARKFFAHKNLQKTVVT
jgi:hypothetical protein